MAITLVGFGPTEHASIVGTTGHTVTLPTHVEDDLLIMYSDWGDDNGGVFSIPSGWAEIAPFSNVESAAADTTQRILWKWAGASEPATVAVTCDYTGAEYWGVTIAAFRGVHRTTPFDVAAHANQYAYRTTKVVGTNTDAYLNVTTVTDGAWVLCYEKIMGNDVTGPLTLTDYTLQLDNSGNFNAQQLLFTQEVASAGAQVPGVSPYTSGSTRASQTHTMVLRPIEFTSDPDATPPTSLAAVAVSASAIDLSWTESTDIDLVSTKVYRSLSPSVVVEVGNLIATVDAGTEVYADSGLDAETLYYYVATSLDDDPSESVASNEVSDTTDALPALGGATAVEYGDTMLKALQDAGATSKELVGALNELNATKGVEFDLALRTYRGI